MSAVRSTSSKLALGLLFAIICITTLGLPAWRHYQRSVLLEKRVEDIGVLLTLYMASYRTNSNLDITDLLQSLGTQQRVLHNPIAKNPALPSYQIGRGLKLGDLSTTIVVVVEESDNITDAQVRVRGYSDGSVRVER
jgi:hypothetical protein